MELKSESIHDMYWDSACGGDTERKVYLKSEVDKVIVDLEESHKMEVEQLLIEIVKLKEVAKKNSFLTIT